MLGSLGSRLDWAFVLLVLAQVAAVFWLSGLAGTASTFTIGVFWLALLLSAALFAMRLVGGRRSS